MKQLSIKLIPEHAGPRREVPLNIVLVDAAQVGAGGLSEQDAIRAIAKAIGGPVGINLIDMNAVTTTSDGIAVEGAIVMMAAGDIGRVHAEFGILGMAEMPLTEALIEEEPHLVQIRQLYPGRRFCRGPNPADKLIPVHNAAMTGRAVNNNSGTEMMNVITMEEILLPILGQLELMRGGDVLIGPTGDHISVGIGMTVAEMYGRVFPSRQFRAGDTAHASGAYAKTLKSHIPCICASKTVLARYIVQALRLELVPGLHLGCSPAVLAVAKALGCPIQFDNITAKAREELASVGMGPEFFAAQPEPITESELLARADEIIPGAEDTTLVPAGTLIQDLQIPVA